MGKFRESGSDDSAMGRFVDLWNGAAVWDRTPAGERATLCRLACKLIADFAMLFDAAWDADTFDCMPCADPARRPLAGSGGTGRGGSGGAHRKCPAADH
jgi:hypothetical protein